MHINSVRRAVIRSGIRRPLVASSKSSSKTDIRKARAKPQAREASKARAKVQARERERVGVEVKEQLDSLLSTSHL